MLMILFVWGRAALADIPRAETWFEPAASLTGAAGERFGSSISCSGPQGSDSLIAIAAPDYNYGEGRVYIYNGGDLSLPVQTITSGSLGPGSKFGAALSFIRDINGDDKADLIISASRPNGTAASVHAYLSQSVGAPYLLCGVANVGIVAGGATELLPITKSSTATNSSAVVVIGSPVADKIETLTITEVSGFCVFSAPSDYAAQGSTTSLFGGGLAEIKGSSLVDADVAIGAPDTNAGSGFVGVVPQGGVLQDLALGTADQRLGTTMAGDPLTGHFAYSAPNDSLLRVFFSTGTGMYTPVCSASIPMNDLPSSATRGLRLLGGAFSQFFGSGGSDVVYASYRTQPDTGGSVAMFSTHMPDLCGDARTFNNCVFDANQEQGQVLAGGSNCTKDINGAAVPMLLVGSPGWNANTGRVDIVLEGTQLASAKVCSASSATPTPTPTPVVVTPIPVGSGTGGLPAPILESVGAKSAVIVLPTVEVGPTFARFLRRALKISLKEAEKLAKNAVLTYEILLAPSSRSSASMVQAQAVRAKLQKVRTRQQRVTVSRLSPGTVYDVRWRVEISIKKPKRSFLTKTSTPVTLRTSR